MIVMHIESGLGNQMLDYAEYLAAKKCNPEKKIYIETIVFEIPECNSAINMWDGYSLDKVFSIRAPNIREVFSKKQWDNILKYVSESEFWNDNWRYSNAITEAFSQEGLNLINMHLRLEHNNVEKGNYFLKVLKWFTSTHLGYTLKRHLYRFIEPEIVSRSSAIDCLFFTTNLDIYSGHRLKFKYKGNGLERIDHEIKHNYQFPDLSENRNIDLAKIIDNSNSISIHARRGDMVGTNASCYRYGYFKRAVSYMRKNVLKPVFVVFSDPGSLGWCKKNENIFGIDSTKDEIYYVGWNTGEKSFRDMQLMSKCKHNIVTHSTFGWWGSYLNRNPCKITCSPDIRINTTHTF